MRRVFTIAVCAFLISSACARGRRYELKGQIVAVDPVRQELTITHQDIRGFMPGMTMPFKVRDPRLLDGREAGDLVTGTLVVEDTDAYLASVERTGHAALTEAPPAPRMDVLDTGETVPDVRLTEETGTSRSFSEWRGRALAVTFIYTRCPLPDFCPAMDRQFAAVQRAVAADPQLRDRVRLLSISFDPAFDTTAVLAEHARRVGADPGLWHFATGERDAIGAFALRFGVSVMPEEGAAPGIVHNLRTAVIDRNGRVVQIFSGTDWTPAELLEALRRASA
ncbi:MAG: SCO family protein [Acidobacteriota bacterium]